MERRYILAIVLMLIVVVLPSILFPPKKPAGPGPRAGTDSTPSPTLPESGAVTRRPAAQPPVAPLVLPAETVWVTSPLYRLGFSTRGAALVSAELLAYRSFAAGDSARPVQLVRPGRPLLVAVRAAGADTTTFADWSFAPSARTLRLGTETGTLRFDAERDGEQVTIAYRFTGTDYRFGVAGRLAGFGPGGATLLVGMGDGFRSVEGDSLDDFRNYAVVTKATRTQRTDFQSLKPGQQKVLDGPFEWAGVKSKYFFFAALTIDEHAPHVGAAVVTGGLRTVTTSSLFSSSSVATRADLTLTLPVPPTGDYRYDVYVGPLEYHRLAQVGHDLDDANPYGGFLAPHVIVQPVSVAVVNILSWMHERLHLAYGWVLVIFGVLVRLLLWPLNQKAMESSLRMQAIAPLVKEAQDRYKNDPQRGQQEVMRLYREHGVNPVGGCLPMLLPTPVLIALFFVFQNTIAFRGVAFLWLPDLSRADPYYIIPLVMGLSMFVLSKVGQIGVPPNPQAKTMLYFMPAFMTLLFFRFASGLNIYYAASNLFSIPQQYLVAMRRLRDQRTRS